MKRNPDQKSSHLLTGIYGERLAAEYLMHQGHKILARNWHWEKVELDLVVRKGKELVIVEVKTRQMGGLQTPVQAINRKKHRQLQAGADAFLELLGEELECRIDVIAILLEGRSHTIDHYRDALPPYSIES